jgi:hypothetical protein
MSITVPVYSKFMYTYIQSFYKFVKMRAGCGISHKHAKYTKYAWCTELLKCKML